MAKKIRQRMRVDVDSSDSDTEKPSVPMEKVVHVASHSDEQGGFHVRQSEFAVPASPTKPTRADTSTVPGGVAPTVDTTDAEALAFPFAAEAEFDFDVGHPTAEASEDEDPKADSNPGAKKGRQKGQTWDSDDPMRVWRQSYRDLYLQEMLRLKGRGDYVNQTVCPVCDQGGGIATFRCRDCFTDCLLCRECLVSQHKDNPLHRPENWNGFYFENVTLKALGLRIQLGHGRQSTCRGTTTKLAAAQQAEETHGLDGTTMKKKTRENFCIVDINGVHEVALDFCSCHQQEDHVIQLLRAQLYPATTSQPTSAATFRVLRKFHLLSLEAKCSAYHFYNSLARETDNTGTFQPRDRYEAFRRMARQWKHLQMLKRAGVGHSGKPVAATAPGSCAVLCPACPQPGKNLPLMGAWCSDALPREKRHLYALFMAIDANFRMKRKIVSSETKDPALGNGIAFYPPLVEYMTHVKKFWDIEQEKSTCVGHNAVDDPDREVRGTASSGIGTVDCARHNMKRPLSVGDLQKGERYINMDFILWKGLEDYRPLRDIVVSYDIACQWHKNVWNRLALYTKNLQDAGFHRRYKWLIPKFHLPAHIEECNVLYSFNLTPLVGLTDGEAPERGWANANPLATSTKEMGPGARRDTIDDHFNDWNHKKVLGTGTTLLEKMTRGIKGMVEFQVELTRSEAGIHADDLSAWLAEMTAWELDTKKPNPFALPKGQESVYAIRGRLAESVAKEVVAGTGANISGNRHILSVIVLALQIEQEQRNLAADFTALGRHPTDRQRAVLHERSNKLRRKVAGWTTMMESFLPSLAGWRAMEEQERISAAGTAPVPVIPVHELRLHLPSRLLNCKDPLSQLAATVVPESFMRYEFEIRVGQADKALAELRRLLLVRTHQFRYKNVNARGIAENTKSNTSIQNTEARIRRVAAQYRAAHNALSVLGPRLKEKSWAMRLRPLLADDIRGRPRATYADPERRKSKKRKRNADLNETERNDKRPASWIWRVQIGNEDEGDGMVESLKVEWARARARACRHIEEVELVEEEMRRVIEFLGWQANWWADLAAGVPASSNSIQREGLLSYAYTQSVLRAKLQERFAEMWKDVPDWIALARQKITPECLRTVLEEAEGEGELEEDDPVPQFAEDSQRAAAALAEGGI